MDTILYYLRDNLKGPTYFIYVFICFVFIFAIVGYLFKGKYGKAEVKLTLKNEQQNKKNENTKNSKSVEKEVINQKVVNTVQKPLNTVQNKPTETEVKPVIQQPTTNVVNNKVEVKPVSQPPVNINEPIPEIK